MLFRSLPRCTDLIEQSGGGAIADSASRVADILNLWAASPDEIRAIRLAAKTWADAHLDSEREYRAFVEGIRSLS